MKKKTALTRVRLMELLSYDPATGDFTCLRGRKGSAGVGTLAGHKSRDGYCYITIDYQRYLAHRLAWFYMCGQWPRELDHKNQLRSDNRWDNLREANRAQNVANSGARANNKLGFKGVSRDKKKFAAHIQVAGHSLYLGCRSTPEEAAALYLAKHRELYGKFSPSA